MKCATSALHHHLDAHPDVAMSRLKELNFFNGPERPPSPDPSTWWVDGQWHRGLEWYAAQFDPCFAARGESSPAYTSPSYPWTAARMARVLPDVRLLYLVRDPFERALSQYAHHRADGTEQRPPEAALLDPRSQYVARSRYAERLAPYLDHFDASQLLVVVQERLLGDPSQQMARVYAHVGVDPHWRDVRVGERVNTGGPVPAVGEDLRRRFESLVRDDIGRLRDLIGDPVEEWRT